jgi:hypothetical protein
LRRPLAIGAADLQQRGPVGAVGRDLDGFLVQAVPVTSVSYQLLKVRATVAALVSANAGEVKVPVLRAPV